MDDLLSEFLTETTESLDNLDVEIVKFEQGPTDPGLLSHIFRLVHTIKGTCGFLDPTWRRYSDGVYRLKEGLLVVIDSDNLLDYGAAATVSA